MAETNTSASGAPTTEEGLLKDRLKFWSAATGFMVRVAIGLVVLLFLLWFFLV
jgi:hypothetical protein